MQHGVRHDEPTSMEARVDALRTKIADQIAEYEAVAAGMRAGLEAIERPRDDGLIVDPRDGSLHDPAARVGPLVAALVADMERDAIVDAEPVKARRKRAQP